MKIEALVHSELSQAIIGSAMTVLNVLKPGLNEKAYENALVIELRHRGLEVQQQRRFNIYYREQLVDILVPDLSRERLGDCGSESRGGIQSRACRPDDWLPCCHQPQARPVAQFQTRRSSLEACGSRILSIRVICVIRG
jgi:hypothetical protein